MATLDGMVANVISDMAKEGESGVTAAVTTAISNSISHYENEPWWFLETQYQFVTVDGTEYYDVPSDMGATEYSLTIEVSNNTYRMIERSYNTLEDWFVKSDTFTGYPTDFAVYQQQIRMYPVPNGAYTATWSYSQQLGPPSADASNAWTTDAELLIRARTEWQLHALRYHDAEAAAVSKNVEENEVQRLRGKNVVRTMTGKTRKRM